MTKELSCNFVSSNHFHYLISSNICFCLDAGDIICICSLLTSEGLRESPYYTVHGDSALQRQLDLHDSMRAKIFEVLYGHSTSEKASFSIWVWFVSKLGDSLLGV